MVSAVKQGIVAVSVLALGGFSGGCSFAFSEGPPTDHARLAYFDCVSTYGLSVADGIFAAGGLIDTVTTFKKSKQAYADDNSGASRNAAGGVDLALTAVYVASGVYGAIQATRCQKAKEDLEARITRPMVLRPPAAVGAPPRPPLPPPVMVPPPAAAPTPPAPGPDEPTVTPTLPAPPPAAPPPPLPAP
jgi:hypothetical protein